MRPGTRRSDWRARACCIPASTRAVIWPETLDEELKSIMASSPYGFVPRRRSFQIGEAGSDRASAAMPRTGGHGRLVVLGHRLGVAA